MTPGEVLLLAGGYAGALVTVLAAGWWLVKPRVDRRLNELVRHASANAEQLQPGGELHENAATAALAAAELPELRRWLKDVAEHGTQLSRQHTSQLQALEIWRTATEHRLGVFEQALLALLGRELGERLLPAPETVTREARE